MIAFMKDGTVAEFGTHEELVSNDNDYNHLISLDEAKENGMDDYPTSEKNQINLLPNKEDLETPFQHNQDVTNLKEASDEDENTKLNGDEGDLLKYSSWTVLLEYFKVSYNLGFQLLFGLISTLK